MSIILFRPLKYVHLRQICRDTGQHDETQVSVLRPHYTAEAAQNLAVVLFKLISPRNVEDRSSYSSISTNDLTARLFYTAAR